MSSAIRKNKRILPGVPGKTNLENIHSPSVNKPRVKFNEEVIETSFGGTQTPTRIKPGAPLQQKLQDISENIPDNDNEDIEDRRSVSEIVSIFGQTKLNKERNERDVTLVKKLNSDITNDSSTPKTKTASRHSIPATMKTPSKTPTKRLTWEKMGTGTPECFNQVQFETPLALGGSVKSKRGSSCMVDDYDGEDSCSITVAVRVRPFNAREQMDPAIKCVVSMDGNQTTVTAENGSNHHFAYDYSFWSFNPINGDFASQDHVYSSLAEPLLGKVYEGYNTCLFAYGQTGSGKSYTIMGHGEEVGIIPRFSEDLFIRKESMEDENLKINVEISFFEIYNEKIHDLLGSSKDKTGRKTNLKVREHPALGPYVEGLSTYVVDSFEDIQSWISLGNRQRATASTGMNDKSSRSHSVFTIVMTQTRTETLEGDEHEHSITSKVNLVDLAGSERQASAGTTGDRLREGASINKSLMTLGKVISLLAERSTMSNKKKKIFIPYRDSVLTWLLKESLGGNSKTAMIATISPSNTHMEESLSTLRYAKQARTIVNQVHVNEDPKARIIRELRAEIDKLRGMTGTVGDDDLHMASLAEINTLKDKLALKEHEMLEATRTWQERIKQAENRKKEEVQHLEKSGISFKIDNRLPSLVNLNEDPQLSEMLLYILKEGTTRVGRLADMSSHDIQLNGALIANDHCKFDYTEKVVMISPIKDAPCYVNGDSIFKKTTLHHGDRVILGGDHYFRLNHPSEVDKGRKSSTQLQVKDFEFARQELLRVQNAKLQEELDQARKEAEEELNKELEKSRQKAALELSMQRHTYEDRLSELQQMLQKKSSDEERLIEDIKKEAEDKASKLTQQNQMLEQEVEANRKRLELEAKAMSRMAQKTPQIDHSKIVEQLRKEKEKMDMEVKRQKEYRQKLSGTVASPSVVTPRKTDPGKTQLYRMMLYLREANKISQIMEKDVVFSREDLKDGEQAYIKVTNSKLGISTYWSIEKFEDRLVQMREFFQDESDAAHENIFYDPNDVWEQEDRIKSPEKSPRILESANGKYRRRSALDTVRQNMTSISSTSSTPRIKSVTSISSLCSNGSLNLTGDIIQSSVPTFSLCKDFICIALDRFKDETCSESLADKMLYDCECMRMGAASILAGFKQVNNKTMDKNKFMESEIVQVSCVQISTSLELLISHASLWANMYENVTSSLIRELVKAVIMGVKKLGNHLMLFLQGCENDIDAMVTESGTRVLETIHAICKHCGELALATDSNMTTLKDIGHIDAEGNEDKVIPKIGHDIRQAFLTGVDIYVDKTLQGGRKNLEECESKVEGFSENLQSESTVHKSIVKHAEIIVLTTKILVIKCQSVQTELDETLNDSLTYCTENFYQINYQRSQGIIKYVSDLADGVALLLQAAEPVIRGEETDLRRICRCSELIHKSTSKLMAISNPKVTSHGSPDSQSDPSDSSILREAQSRQLDAAAQDVKLATKTLNSVMKKHGGGDATSSNTQNSKSKRLLPASPEKSLKALPKLAVNKTVTKHVTLQQNGETT
ncbi:unnamed protein product [Owenia fusiformis]|uniref:Uncharacterized protein n=1 Tax=Owenia fusiformis TaxID=6347 RepID=A0A8J1UZ34_OWEFU|nr:unnamed protein product [Owenia fusiformis]